MQFSFFVIIAIAYICILFFIAYYTERKKNIPFVLKMSSINYALSLAVYCTAWTYFGSVGKSVKSGLGFLTVYLGPTILAPLWIMVLRKMIYISKNQRITSIADFISSRYGKSTVLAVLVTIMSVFGVIPYISLQLKAITDCLKIIALATNAEKIENFNLHIAFYVAVILATFTIMFAARKPEPNERHEGMVVAIAFESIVKLIAFVAAGIFVTYFVYDGFGDLFQKAAQNIETAKIVNNVIGSSPSEWFVLTLLSVCAILLLPRQFHMAVVENSDPSHVKRAAWQLPLYMLIINIFVLPIALAGMMIFSKTISPDSYVLMFPLKYQNWFLSILVFIGGFSAAASMVIVETAALSIMVSNHLILRPLLTFFARKDSQAANISAWVLTIRRISILIIIALAFVYLNVLTSNQELVSIGLTSFTAVAQFAPCVFLGMYWKEATQKGALAGLIVGFFFWAITLPIPTLAEYHLINDAFITNGYFNWSFLKPYELFGLAGYDHITHAAFWSVLLNIATFGIVSNYTKQSIIEVEQADYFVNIWKYIDRKSARQYLKREAKVEDLVFLMERFLGKERTRELLHEFNKKQTQGAGRSINASSEFIFYVETLLSGVFGTSSASILISTVVTEQNVSVAELLKLLDRTQEIIQSNNALAAKSEELVQMTEQLRSANTQLQQIDRLKADFISTVTHELRTPMTSIKAFSKILLDNKDLTDERKETFLRIVVSETERVSRLINQVLDIEKYQSNELDWNFENFCFVSMVREAYAIMKPSMDTKNILSTFESNVKSVEIKGDRDKLLQAILNLISNARKFASINAGEIHITVEKLINGFAFCSVSDNGVGVPDDKKEFIFERFTQISDAVKGKPRGSGLGLFITKRIIEHHGGTIGVKDNAPSGALFYFEIPI